MHRTSNDFRVCKESFSQFYTVINFSRLIRNLQLELLRWPSKLTLFVWQCPPPFSPHIFPNKVPSHFKISSIRRISSSTIKLEPFFLLVSSGRPNCTSITALLCFFYRYTEVNEKLDATCIHYITNIIPDIYVSFCVLYTFHETACILEKKMGLSIYSVELRTLKSYSTEYILKCVGGRDLSIFSVMDVLNTWVWNWGWVPYSVGGGGAWWVETSSL